MRSFDQQQSGDLAKENAADGRDAAAVAAPAAPEAFAPQVAVAPAPPAGSASSPSLAQILPPDDRAMERRHPLRFVWQMDAAGRFVVGSDEFIALVGPRATAALGRLWSEIAAELALDPEGRVARAVATRETWSGVVLHWPVDESSERLPVEFSGLPVFDRDRIFCGYRGFGVCRDIARINQLAHARRERPLGFVTPPQAPPAADDVTEPPAAPAASAASAPVPVAGEDLRGPDAAPAAANVVPFRGALPEPKAPSLSPVEHRAFRELAQELTARLRGARETSVPGRADVPAAAEQPSSAEPPSAPTDTPAAGTPPFGEESGRAAAASPPAATVASLVAAEQAAGPPREDAEEAQPQAVAAVAALLLDHIPVGVLIYRNDSLLYANRHLLEWSGYASLGALAAAGGLDALFLAPGAVAPAESDAQSLSMLRGGSERLPLEGRLLPVPWDGAGALALILAGGEAEESRRAAEQALGAALGSLRELESARAGEAEARRRIEEDLRAAKREAQDAAAAKADFLAKISHEIRTPLNAITGFAELIMAERFGPISNARYRDYLKDIHAAGTHLVSLLNDLLDLSKIECGRLDLTFAPVSLNDLTQQCVGIMQPQASRARTIIRTSLAPGLPSVLADERSLRQIVLNLIANSIRFTGPGGQVIVSTAFAGGVVVLRVRDTGVGMSDKDIVAALEPLRMTATSASWGSGGTGLELPLTKALAEANHAHFSIKSAPNAGTLVEVAFPAARVVV